MVIPEVLRPQLLCELHENHQGMVKMKALGCSHFWWPNLDSYIEALVNNCQTCQFNRHQLAAAPVHNWSWPNRPWQRIHVVYAQKGKFNFLVVTDSYSRWPEVALVNSTTSEKTIEVLRGYFATWGLPDELVSDNGPQFVSVEFETFLRNNGVKHIKSSPYHPQSNWGCRAVGAELKNGPGKRKG